MSTFLRSLRDGAARAAARLGIGPNRSAIADTDLRVLIAAGSESKTGLVIGVDQALRCSTAIACVRSVAQGLAQVSCGLYRPTADGRGHEPAIDHPVYGLLAYEANEWMTAFEFRETMIAHAFLTGDAVAWKVMVNGRVAELIPLMPGCFSIEQAPDYSLTYRITTAAGDSLTVGREQVLHLRGLSWNTYTGLEALRLAREAIGLAVATEESQARLHANGARPGGILTLEGAKPGTEAFEKLRAEWQAQYSGVANAMKTAVLNVGAKWQPMAMTGVDAQHLETRRFQIEEICRALGVFPQMVGHSDKATTYASAEAFFQAHVTNTLQPWAERYEQTCRRDLLSGDEKRKGFKVNLDLRRLERGDTAARTAYYTAGIQNGYLSRNDVRVMEGENPQDGLDDYLVPLNMARAGEAAKPADPSSVPPGAAAARPGSRQAVGRVLSAANEGLIRGARDDLSAVLEKLDAQPDPSEDA